MNKFYLLSVHTVSMSSESSQLAQVLLSAIPPKEQTVLQSSSSTMNCSSDTLFP